MKRYLDYIQTQIKARDQHIMALIDRRKLDIQRMHYMLAHLQHMGAHEIARLINSDMEMEIREDEEKHLLSSPPPPSPYPSRYDTCQTGFLEVEDNILSDIENKLLK